LLRRSGRIVEAVDHYQQALDLVKVAERQDPASAVAKEIRSICHYRLGECLMKLNDAAGAFDHQLP
jgi:hypothetical protein